MKRVRVKDGKSVYYAIVDVEDYARVIKYSWCMADRNGEYGAPATIVGKTIKTMAHIVWGTNDSELFIDHIDGDPFNNRKENLRLVTRNQNAYNSKKAATYNGGPTSSRFKGVYKRKAPIKGNLDRTVWYTDITVGGKRIYIGRFEDEVEAACRYDMASEKYHGEFGRRNFDGAAYDKWYNETYGAA